MNQSRSCATDSLVTSPTFRRLIVAGAVTSWRFSLSLRSRRESFSGESPANRLERSFTEILPIFVFHIHRPLGLSSNLTRYFGGKILGIMISNLPLSSKIHLFPEGRHAIVVLHL